MQVAPDEIVGKCRARTLDILAGTFAHLADLYARLADTYENLAASKEDKRERYMQEARFMRLRAQALRPRN